MKVNLGHLVSDFAAQRELALSVSQTPCRLCTTGNSHRSAQDDDFEESESFSDKASQLP